MKRYLVCCGCGGMDRKAKATFSVLFPQEEVPPVIRGKDNVQKLATSLDNEHIKALSKLSGKFAYYLELNDDNTITKEVDLLRKARVK